MWYCNWYSYPEDLGYTDCEMSWDPETFEEWIGCYEKDGDTCGANHSEYYDCYWNNQNCEDPSWHNCYWYSEGCEDGPEDVSDYESGYKDGYHDGYNDGVVDFTDPEPQEIEPFVLEMVIKSFETWVNEQEMRAGRFHCDKDIRIDFPFDDMEYMALWASHNCADWDLYLTVVVDKQTSENALTYAGADPSYGHGCYETSISEDAIFCEFYLPHGGDNFGILFQGGFHPIWYEFEWVHNPEYKSLFGDW